MQIFLYQNRTLYEIEISIHINILKKITCLQQLLLDYFILI